MLETVKTQIIHCEERLRQAMLASDVNVLDELIADDILITSHLGELLSKQDDLDAHRSSLFKIDELHPSEQKIQVHGGTAIVSVRMQVAGSYKGSPANGNFRYTRVWAMTSTNQWQIVAAHIGMIT